MAIVDQKVPNCTRGVSIEKSFAHLAMNKIEELRVANDKWRLVVVGICETYNYCEDAHEEEIIRAKY